MSETKLSEITVDISRLLSDEAVRNIRELLKTKMSQTKIGQMFGVGHTMISNIKLGKTRQEISS